MLLSRFFSGLKLYVLQTKICRRFQARHQFNSRLRAFLFIRRFSID